MKNKQITLESLKIVKEELFKNILAQKNITDTAKKWGTTGAKVGAGVGALSGISSYDTAIKRLESLINATNDPEEKIRLQEKLAKLIKHGHAYYTAKSTVKGALAGGALAALAGGYKSYQKNKGIEKPSNLISKASKMEIPAQYKDLTNLRINK